MTVLTNRHALVVDFKTIKPVVLGVFKHYVTACDRRDAIAEYMEDEHNMLDGEDYSIWVTSCYSTDTTIQDLGDDIATLVKGAPA